MQVWYFLNLLIVSLVCIPKRSCVLALVFIDWLVMDLLSRNITYGESFIYGGCLIVSDGSMEASVLPTIQASGPHDLCSSKIKGIEMN